MKTYLNNQNKYEKWVIQCYHRGCQSLVNLWKTHNRLIARCLLLQILSLDDQNQTTTIIQSERTHKASSRVSEIWKMSFTMNSRLNLKCKNWNLVTAQAWRLRARRGAWAKPGVTPGKAEAQASAWACQAWRLGTRRGAWTSNLCSFVLIC